MKILLVSPRTPDTFWSFRHALPFISSKSGYPPLGLLTVAAMLPDSWELKLVDLDAHRLHDSDVRWADYVMIGAMIVHRDSVREIARRCRDMGKTVIAGGPLFSDGHESFPEIPHFVLGEAEDLMEDLVRDMEAGTIRPTYEAGKFPDLSRSPVPRWDLVDFGDYANLSIQFCRGCPFDCEFCDITVLNGRLSRTKSPEQVVEELESLRVRGWKGSVFIVDDNFLGNRKRVKALLQAVIAWRREKSTPMAFLTEASVDLAGEPEVMSLMVEAGFKAVFVGIETPDIESLRACKKLQNTRRDLTESVRAIQAAGMEVMGGFIVGFDGDTPDIFQRQFEFIQKAGVVTAMVGILNAIPRTRLYKRLKAEGRLLEESNGNNTEATLNFITRLNPEELIAGYRGLMNKLYEPNAYYERAKTMLRNCRPRGPRVHVGRREVGAVFRSLWHLGVVEDGRRAFWGFMAHALFRHPRALGVAITISICGHHLRVVSRAL